tara:strand:+ start:1749 stop:2237 length:489 start_codon:yes stop_codon:yes gene_type:complete
MASTVVKHFTDGSIEFADGTGSPVTLALALSVGDFSASGFIESQQDTNVYQSRGSLHSVRKGAKNFISGSFSAMLADLSDASAGDAVDFILKQNAYSANLSTLSGSDVYAIKITLTIEGTDLGDSSDHVLVLDDCVVTLDISEGEPDTLAFSFTSYAAPTMT